MLSFNCLYKYPFLNLFIRAFTGITELKEMEKAIQQDMDNLVSEVGMLTKAVVEGN